MSYTKILPTDLQNKGVIGLPDTPGLDTTAMQQKFDEIALDVIVPKFNNLVDELDETVPDVSGKADKVSGATSGNFAGLDSNGNLTDSGSKASDFISGIVTTAQGGTGNSDGYIRTGLRSGTTAGNYATAEGKYNIASGDYSHSEGYQTTASGECSHAEGGYTTASGEDAHSEGNYTTASGKYSHAEGFKTTAGYDCQHVVGRFNDNKSTTLMEVGGGVYGNKKNVFEVYSDGSLSQDNGTTKFKFTKYNNQDGYYDASGTFHAFGSGSGTGDMQASTYDPDGDVATAGGIPDYVTSQLPDVTGKADKVSSATSGNFAALDSNGNLTDSGHKHSDYLTSHQDISGKADKVSSPTNGDFAGLDSNGNLTDSGKKASDFCSVTSYDPNGTVATAGGIVAYIDATITAALTASY